jgi:glycosyltransferase involved in cell wall biosynthesis
MNIAVLNINNGMVQRGSEVFVEELASRLSKKNNVTVFQTGIKKSENYNVIQIKDIPFQPLQGYKGNNFIYDLSVLFFTLKCLNDLKKGKYDWVVPINGKLQVLFIRFFRYLYKYKILISGHAGIGFDDRWNLTIGKPDVFIALSKNAETWAKKISPKTTIAHIPNGIDLDNYHSGVTSYQMKLQKPVVLCVSALVDYKRVDLVIRAVKQLKSVSLLIVGDGSLRDDILELGSKYLGERFQLITTVDNKIMPSIYCACDLFTLPSRKTEAFGIVYLEALACNLPVVAPDDENRKVIIGDGGIYCNVENIYEYANSISRAIQTDFKDKPRKQAETFSWDKITERYEKIFSFFG